MGLGLRVFGKMEGPISFHFGMVFSKRDSAVDVRLLTNLDGSLSFKV